MSGGMIRPFYHEDRPLIRVPHIWEDDVHCACRWEWDVKAFIRNPGLKVFDFHPVHVFLNTESMDRYRAYKEATALGEALSSQVNTRHRGTMNFLEDLLGTAP
jgi:hypothetical protein